MFRNLHTRPAPRGGGTCRRPRLTLQTLEDRTAPAAGPRVQGGNPPPPPDGKPFAPISQVTVIFDRTMDPTTFTPADVVSFTGPNGPITVTNVAPTQFGGNQTFAISFDQQGTAGLYTLVIGPDIRDTAGRLMDQNNNDIAGEDPGDRATRTFQLFGPRVSGRSATFTPDGSMSEVMVVFQPSNPGIIDGSTFTPEDVVLTGPNGPITVTSVTPNPIRPTFEFFVNFAPQTAAGVYNFSVGPSIADTFGNLLDQNQDGIGGVAPGDVFSNPLQIAPFRLDAMTPNGLVPGGSVSSARLFFNRSVNAATIGLDDIVSFTGPGGVSIPVTSITPVDGSTTQFDLGFALQSAIGTYTLVVGPNISDTLGNGMDNNSNFTPGEVPGDRFTGTFSVLGPRVNSGPGGGLNVTTTTVAFSQPMDPATFTLDDITLTGPNGAIPVTSVTPNPGNQSFTIAFPAQTQFGRYDWVVGPDIRNTFGVAMDQNQNFIAGETPGDQRTASFNLTAPRVANSSPTGVAPGPISTVTVTFDRDMNASTFTPADVVSFTGPGGVAIPVNSVTTTNNRTFSINFDAQNADGVHTLVIGPDIRDTFGNPMNQDNDNIPGEDPGDRFTTSFQLNIFGPDPFFGYIARRHAWEDINLEPDQSGVFTILDNVDDAAAQVDLGTNTFNFYGQVYTGASQMFVNTNGMITFGSPTNQPNTGGGFQKFGQFQQLVAQPYIAALYRDWTTSNSTFPDGVPSGAVLGKFEDTTGDGTPDRLIVEWSDMRNWISLSANRSVTFQAILDLNTGANASPVTLNYVATQTLDPGVDNGNIVGIRPSGGLPTFQITPTNQFGPLGFPPSPWVGPGNAMRFTGPPIGGTVRGAKFHDFDRDGAHDAGEPGLAGWQVYLDENGNGALDTGEPTATTDADGNYEFTAVVPVTHVVREVVQPGWVQTRPGAGGTVTNGGFESGDLTGWQTIGYVENKAIHGVVPPAEGHRQLFMWSGLAFGVQPAPAATLEAFLGVASGTLSSVTGVPVIQGAAVKQTVFATAGSSLTFDYNLLTGETPLAVRDTVFITVAGDGGAVAANNARQLRGADPSGFSFMQTGYETFAFTFPTTGTYTIGIGVVDGAGGFNSSGLLLDNVRLIGDAFPVGVRARQTVAGKEFGNYTPPVASVTGPPSGVRGQGRTFTLGATDAYPPDQAAGFTFDIDWNGDGTFDQTVTGLDGTQVEHVYPVEGNYTVTVRATDQHGTTSELASHTIPIAIVELQADPGDPAKTALAVGGTQGNDGIQIKKNGSPGAIRVVINDIEQGVYTPTGPVLVYAQSGDDHVLVTNNLTAPTMIFGGDGNDQLDGGAGQNILIGGAGNDFLKGSGVRDLLVGGGGADAMEGKGDDDLLIAGLTAYDDDEAALSAIMAEWSRTDQTYEERVDHLRNGGGSNGSTVLNATTVTDDDNIDTLIGAGGRDWFFARQSGLSIDLIVNLAGDEEVN